MSINSPCTPDLRPRSGGDQAARNADQRADETDGLLRRFVAHGPLTGQLPTYSHPFVERLIGTIRREYLDHILFWNRTDLERKLETFRQYYNTYRVHTALNGDTPLEISGKSIIRRADLNSFQWQSHCSGLYQLPIAA